MIGFFIYWYQTRLDNPPECRRCEKRDRQRRKNRSKSRDHRTTDADRDNERVRDRPNRTSKQKRAPVKSVRFNDEVDRETDISLDSLDSSDKANSSSVFNDDDTETCDSLDI